MAIAEQRSQLSGFPAVGNIKAAALSPAYQARLLGIDRVATGLEVGVLDLDATDVYRWSYRLFAERQTGMLLRAEIRGAQGELLESSAFSELNVGIRPQVAPDRAGDEQARRVRDPPSRAATGGRQPVRVEIWQDCPQVSGARRGQASAAHSGWSGNPCGWQFMISDGLAQSVGVCGTFSPDLPSEGDPLGFGSHAWAVGAQGKWWLTAMGEVPPRALRELIQTLEQRNKP